MTAYKLSPYLVTIENRLTRGPIQYGLFHRLSGEIVEFTPSLQMFVTAVRKQGGVQLDLAQLENQPVPNTEFVNLIHLGFLIETYLTVLWFLGHKIGDRPLLLLGVLMIVTGIQFFSMGFIGEFLTYQSQKRQHLQDDLPIRDELR